MEKLKTYKTRIYYEDTDCGGVVYHTNYIKYCERARSEFLLSNNIDLSGSGFVVGELSAKFLKPAKLGDIIEVKTKCLEVKNASVVLLQDVLRDDLLLFSLNVKLVFVDKKIRPSKIGEDIKALLLRLG